MLRKAFLAGLAGLSMVVFTALPAKADEWALIGERKAGLNPDRDVFNIGSSEGRFSALKFRALGNSVAVAEVRVFFKNGTSQYLNVQEHMKPGEYTRPYDLNGQERSILRVEVLYQSENPYRGQAMFQIFGQRQSTAASPAVVPSSDWVTLGSVVTNRGLDHDTIFVGGGMGTFRTLRFHVTQRSIFLNDVRITFGNGQQQVYNFNQHVSASAWSVPLDLRGDERVISRIDVVYRKDSDWPGNARLTVQGQR
jgi:hypothetical protein